MGKVFLLLPLLVFMAGNLSAQLWKQYADSAILYNGQKKTSRSLHFFNLAREELKRDSAGTRTYAYYTNYLGSCHLDLAEYEKAEALYLEAKEIREKLFGKRDTLYASSCFNLGLVNKRMNRYQKAESFYLEAKSIREEVAGTEDLFYARICNNLGNLYTDLNEYKKAEQFLIQSLVIREKIAGTDDPAYAQSVLNLGALYSNTSQFLKAEKLLIVARQIRGKNPGKESPDYALSCDNLGHVYLKTGEFRKAEPLFLEALQVWEKSLTKNHPAYASGSNHLALLYMEMAEYEKAEALFLEAKQIRERFSNNNLDYSSSCDNLAQYYKVTGQYKKAEPLFSVSKQIRENILGKKHADYGSACENLGNIYYEMEHYEKAELLYREALEIRKLSTPNDSIGIAYSYTNIANVYSVNGKLVKAAALYEEARTILGTTDNKLSIAYANSCYNLGSVYLDLGDYPKAETLFLETRQVREKILSKDHPDYAASLFSLALINGTMKKTEQVNEYYAEAFQIQKSQWNKILRFSTETEQEAYLKKTTEPINLLLSFNTTAVTNYNKRLIYDIILSTRNLLLSSSMQLRQSIYTMTDTSVKNRYTQWVKKREQLSFLLSNPLTGQTEYINDLENQVDLLEKELVGLSDEFRNQQQQQTITSSSIQQSLKQDEAAIEFASYKYFDGNRWTDSIYYVALVLRKDVPEPVMVKLFEEKQLDSVLRKTREINFKLTINNRYGKNSSLYQLLWQPLEKHLAGISKIYFSPSGALHEIPLGALAISQKERVSDKYKLVQLISTAALTNTNAAQVSAADKLFLYGGVLYDGDTSALKQAAIQYKHNNDMASRSLPEDASRGNIWKYLQGTKTEVITIEKMALSKNISASVYEGWEATEESLKFLTGKNAPEFLHIATHGFFFPDPKLKATRSVATEGRTFRQSDNPLFRSGLLLAGANYAWNNKPVSGIQDGIVTAYEISNMYLPNTKLAVLSACETGLGNIQGTEGVYGLQRAFKIAGVKNLVMSLWKVPDAETAEFMTGFYKKMFDGQSIEDAFYNTQTLMKNKYRSEPYNWAAWILVK